MSRISFAHLVAPLIMGSVALGLGAAPSRGQIPGPDDFYFDNVELSGIYTAPSIAGAGDFVTGSGSQPLLSNVAVVLIFPGTYWATSEGAGVRTQCQTSVLKILGSPYLDGIRQYGFTTAAYVGSVTDTSRSLPTSFTHTDLQHVIDPNRSGTIPAGYTALYVVVPPPGTTYSVAPSAGGEHFSYTSGSATIIAAWIRPGNFLTSFAHELIEAATDPIVGKNWVMDRSFGNAGNQEIGDAGEALTDTLPGDTNVADVVGPYWSQYHQACIIPAGHARDVGGNPLATYVNAGGIHLFSISDNRHVWESTRNPVTGSWTSQDLTLATGAPHARGGSALTCYYDPTTPTGHVDYLGADGNLEELYFLNGQWNWNDLTAAVNGLAPPRKQIDGDRALSGCFDTAGLTQHVFYVDFEHDVCALEWSSATWWTFTNITFGLNEPLLGTQLSALYDGAVHVFYIDQTHHVREQVKSGTTWKPIDWTGGIGTTFPLPGVDAVATLTETSPRPITHVFFIDQVGHIEEMVRVGAWYGCFDLSALTGDTSLPAAPALSVYLDAATQIHLYFIGWDMMTHECVRTSFALKAAITRIGLAPTYIPSWTASAPLPGMTGAPLTLPSRALTACYDPGHQLAGVFDICQIPDSPSVLTSQLDAGPAASWIRSGSLWLPRIATPAAAPINYVVP